MDFENAFPLRFWINLGRREDRRVETEARLAEVGIEAEQFVGIDGGRKRSEVGKSKVESRDGETRIRKPDSGVWKGGVVADGDVGGLKVCMGERGAATGDLRHDAPATEVRGYESAGRYALALTQRLILREAGRRGAPAVLLLEDDVVFHPNFRELVGAVELPEDWAIFYLGCAHAERPDWAGTRWRSALPTMAG
jgi:hypothetical protein